MKRLLTALLVVLTVGSVLTASTRTLKLGQIPDSLRTPHDRAAYLAMHYWDSLDFADPTVVLDTLFVEQSFVDFLTLLPIITPAETDSATARLMRLTAVNPAASRLLALTAEKYLDFTDSPFYSDPFYLSFLRAVNTDANLPAADKARFAYRLDMALKNLPGTPATDFPLTLRDGSSTTIRNLPAPGVNRLLIFYDPECDHCVDFIHTLAANPAVTAAVADGSLSVTAVYTEGDPEVYARSAALIPPTWTDALTPDNPVENDELYYLPEQPAIYLLDNASNVLLRNLRPEDIQSIISAVTSR